MALTLSVAFKGIYVEDAYVRVVLPTISSDKKSISYGVHYHKMCYEPLFDAQTLQSLYDLNGPNPFQQAYEFLKTQPQFEGAKDC